MTNRLPDALDEVRAALDRLALALTSGQPETVLSAEEPLALALEALRRAGRSADSIDVGVRTSITAVREALARCRALGDAATGWSGTLWHGPAYERRQAVNPTPWLPARLSVES